MYKWRMLQKTDGFLQHAKTQTHENDPKKKKGNEKIDTPGGQCYVKLAAKDQN